VSLPGAPGVQAMEVLAFLTVEGAEKGLAMFRQYNRGLTYLAPFHYHVTAAGQIMGKPDNSLVREAHGYGVRVLPVISNFVGPQFNPFIIRNIITHRDIQDTLINNLIEMLDRSNSDGVNLDLENMFPEDRALFTAFVTRLANIFRARGKLVTISVPAMLKDEPSAHWKGAFDYRAIGQAVDRVVLMTYEEHWPGSDPGPIASIPWITGVLTYAASNIDTGKLLLGVPMYGYDWPLDKGKGKSVTYTRAMNLASRYQAEIQWDDVMQAPHFSYTDDNGVVHRVWFENVASIRAKVAVVRRFGIKGIGIWEMKLTFPDFWRYALTNVPAIKL